MSYSVYPAPSSGITVNDLITKPKWTLIESYNTNSGSSKTFSSLSGYGLYRLAFVGMRWSNSANIEARINGVTTARYFQIGEQGINVSLDYAQSNASSFYLGYYHSDSAVPSYGYMDIYNANSNGFKEGELYLSTRNSANATEYMRTKMTFDMGGNPGPVTSIEIFNVTGPTFNFNTSIPGYGLHLYGGK